MNDLISRQDAIDVADYTDCTGLTVEDVKKVTDEVIKSLKRLPTIDVKHGRWIQEDMIQVSNAQKEWDVSIALCPRCKGFVYQFYSNKVNYNFCPNCGVRMDGDTYETD